MARNKSAKKRAKKAKNKTLKVARKDIMMKKPVCSPANPEKNNDITCYSNNTLDKIKKLWNARHAGDKIDSNEPHAIWNHIRDRFSNVCNTEKCWLRQKLLAENLDSDILSYTFAPSAPKEWKKNPFEWLSSTDISSVMSHFEKQYPSFIFIGPTPIDFDKSYADDVCVWDELCNFSLISHIKRGKKNIGMIFNTDPHTEDGEHWICMFLDLSSKPNPFIFFFDSNGDLPPDEVTVLKNRIVSQGETLGMKIDYDHNHPKVHQKSDGECGMFCLFTIIQLLLKNKRVEDFKTKRITDDEVKKLRNVYFDHSEN